jgi:hypothetical protein
MPETPRAFVLQRDEDVTGVSGTGVVAEGVAFSDGTVALRWTSEWPTSVVFHERGIESVEAVHGHDGRTQVAWAMVAPTPEPDHADWLNDLMENADESFDGDVAMEELATRYVRALELVAEEALRVVLRKGHGDTALWDALHAVFPEKVPAGD